MATKIQKWGNSLAVRLPMKLMTRLGLQEGSEVVVDEREQNVLIKRAIFQKKTIGKRNWREFISPTDRKKENVSGQIDKILYGEPLR